MKTLIITWVLALCVALAFGGAPQFFSKDNPDHQWTISIPGGKSQDTGSFLIPFPRDMSSLVLDLYTDTPAFINKKVLTVTPSDAIDGYKYCCTLITDAAAAETLIVTYTTAVQKMTMAIRPTTADSTKYDTTEAVNCSIAFEATTLGFLFDPSEMGSELVSELVDSLVDSINALIGDSVTATESGTGILITSDHSEDVLTDRFTMSCNDSLNDTASVIDSVAGIIDTLVALINADADAFFKAYDSATYVQIKFNVAGSTFTAGLDSSGDSATTVEIDGFSVIDTLLIYVFAEHGTTSMKVDSMLDILFSVDSSINHWVSRDSLFKLPYWRVHWTWGDSALVAPEETAFTTIRLDAYAGP